VNTQVPLYIKIFVLLLQMLLTFAFIFGLAVILPLLIPLLPFWEVCVIALFLGVVQSLLLPVAVWLWAH
jgi:hypothetical protein